MVGALLSYTRYLLHLLAIHVNAVQSVCAIVGVVAVCIYTSLTRSIRLSTVAQMNAAQRPLIVLDEDSAAGDWKIINKGNGPALGLYWKTGSTNSETGWQKLGAVAKGDWSDLPDLNGVVMQAVPPEGVRIHYKDLADNFYCTVVENFPFVIQQDAFYLPKKERLHLRVLKS
jgi:hypothetical protein